jgi:hypothetical protein
MITKVIVKGEPFEYPVFDYLSTSIFEFAVKMDIDIWTTKTLRIDSQSQLDGLIHSCELALHSLLNKFYLPPEHDKRSKYPSRYRKIYCNGEEYVIDYRANVVGREAFSIYSFIEWLKSQRKLL